MNTNTTRIEYKYNYTWIQIKYNSNTNTIQLEYKYNMTWNKYNMTWTTNKIRFEYKYNTTWNQVKLSIGPFTVDIAFHHLNTQQVSFSGGYSIFPKKKRKFPKLYWHNETNSITFL